MSTHPSSSSSTQSTRLSRPTSSWAARLIHAALLAATLGSSAILLPPAALYAQSDNSAVTGTITDPAGAVVAGAKVTVTNETTGLTRTVTTNASGAYSVNGIAPGKYTISVAATGFAVEAVRGNNVDPSLPSTVNLSLKVGSGTETVQVTAEETPLNADTSTLGRVITSNQIDNLPINGRNPIYAALTKAGITSGPGSPITANASGAASNVSSFNFSTGLGSIQINGGRERDNLLTFDGAVAVRIRASGDSVGVPDLDAVQEVQVLATNYGAEYGRSIGGQIRIITKSGGANFHGSAYEYLQNPVLNANTWVRNHTNGVNNSNPLYPQALKTNYVQPFTYNQFGFNLTGPLYIPHFLPKGKVFFLYSEGFVQYPQTVNNPVTVPNPAFRTGDFSSVAQHIKDPQSGLACDPTAGGPGCFPGNIIPQYRLSPNGVGLLSIFPDPTPNFQVGSANLLQVAKYPARQQIDSGNLDILPTDKDYIRFRLIHFFYHEDNPFSAAYDTVPRLYDRPNQTGSLSWVRTLNSKTLNEVLLTASHDAARLSIDTSTGLYDRTKYGVNYPFLFPGTKDLPNKIPTIKFDSTNSGITAMDGSAYPSHSQGEIFDYADTFTRVIGDHTIKAGALYERSGENDRDQIAFSTSTAGQTNNQNGQFDFNGTNNKAGTGYDLADAALGLYYTYSEVGARAETPYRGNLYEFFAQDSFKATPKLHLEYGVRYTSIHPYYSLWNNAGSFDPAYYNASTAIQVNPSTGNPIAGTGDPLSGTVLWGDGFTGSAKSHVPAAAAGQYANLFHNLPRGYTNVQKFLFQPRVGVAYSVNDKTVFRTGFGRYTNRQGVSDFVFAGGIPPLQQVASVSSGTADNPGAGSNGTYPQLSGDIDQNSPQPEAYIWNASVERQIGFQTVAEVSYVGRHALHQQYGANINQLQPGTLTNPANKGISANALRPYQGYSAINLVEQGDTAFYQGLQVDITRRFTHGLGFGTAYTFASSRDCASFQKSVVPNTFDPKAICGPSDYDVRQVLVLNAVYEIPFKSGSHLLNQGLAGWQLTQVYQFQSGAPFSIATTQDIAGVGPGSGPQLLQFLPGASLKGNGKFSNSSTDSNSWFNIGTVGAQVFTTPAPGTFTTQHNRNILRAPGQDYFNASLQKRFATFEGQSLNFRVDAFDFPNHPNWNAPDTTYVDSTFFGSKTPTFGKVTSKNLQRSLQASLRYSF
ncbi:TonB-dependent receptor [Granulicella aggregans]|uniref:TonB-dependent receptor n=1 Tax=Granulicella aggregans TaxID=474949 RepID=UPI0021E09E35|nr:TonB-dependent receptor [Granulicella aggregans]